MTISAPLKVSKAEFFEFVQTQEGRFEWEQGRIVQQMTGGTFDHSDLVQRFARSLMRQLDEAQWVVLFERGVETEETVRYPDVVVEAAGAPRKSLSTSAPALIIEVLSPTSEKRDLGAKPVEYASLASLQAYIAASQDGPECWVWRRSADGVMPTDAELVAGSQAAIAVPALGVTFDLGEIYRGIGA